MPFAKGDQVKLRTFLGTLKPRKARGTENNFWRLIGQKGKVIDDAIQNKRILVLFEKHLDEFEVANHNPIPNSLWIKPSDLRLDI
ncbi:hypothetical protein [Mucilaginibacter sp. BT774]|uniref:hypothetical protein n=1 Tax=Mucilaginibacter sp. BT774 TaxID=3062276 RepID=UPI002677351C|nr:hypothetical protein [Mucilaginibacter sp. BT774]MDO3627897.1 hypothetical protein [Mucilaginibacter sp. BT774]